MQGKLCTPQVLYLARDAFERLMGPAEKVLAERIREYETANSEAAGKPVATTQAPSRQVCWPADYAAIIAVTWTRDADSRHAATQLA